MAASSTEICNLALGHIGVGKQISNLDTDRSNEALACNRFYQTALDQVERDHPWGFTRKYAALGLVQSNPTTEWGFSYRVPSDCLAVKRILSGLRNDFRESRVSYQLGQDSGGVLIYSDAENAVLEYTARVTDVTQFTPDFIMAFSLYLGALIAPTLTGGDPFKIRASTMQLYESFMMKAKVNNANEDQDDPDPMGEFIRGRY